MSKTLTWICDRCGAEQRCDGDLYSFLHQDPEHGWSFVMPDDWRAVPVPTKPSGLISDGYRAEDVCPACTTPADTRLINLLLTNDDPPDDDEARWQRWNRAASWASGQSLGPRGQGLDDAECERIEVLRNRIRDIGEGAAFAEIMAANEQGKPDLVLVRGEREEGADA